MSSPKASDLPDQAEVAEVCHSCSERLEVNSSGTMDALEFPSGWLSLSARAPESLIADPHILGSP